MSKIRCYPKYSTFCCFFFHVKQPKVDLLGPQRDRCISEFVLHGTVLITNFSVFPQKSLIYKKMFRHLMNKCIFYICEVSSFSL